MIRKQSLWEIKSRLRYTLDEAQAGIKIAGRNVNNLRYTDDNTLMAESEEELKSLLMKVKVESEKVDLKLNIQKTKIKAPAPIISWQIDRKTVRTGYEAIDWIQTGKGVHQGCILSSCSFNFYGNYII